MEIYFIVPMSKSYLKRILGFIPLEHFHGGGGILFSFTMITRPDINPVAGTWIKGKSTHPR